jgi:preprotein translocase subunit SecD
VSKFRTILTNWRVMMMIIVVVLALIAIHPNPWTDGVSIKSVEKNSSAALAGIANPKANVQPMARERVLSVNGVDIHSVGDYYASLEDIESNQTLTFKTNLRTYSLRTKPIIERIVLNTTSTVMVEVNGTNVSRQVPDFIERISGVDDIGLAVDDAPVTNLRKGLDLQGGTRVILQPAEPIDEETMALLIDSLTQRLNVFGLSDLVIAPVSDQLILIELAGASSQEILGLVGQQGKFEAKVGDVPVFRGGNKDVTYVCRTAECSGLDPERGCGQVEGGWACAFRFSIALSPEAAQRQADATRNLPIEGTGADRYLSEPLNLYLDDELVRSLSIGASLRGQAVTDIQISGSGSGISQQEALTNTFSEMKTLQTVLITGSLPVKLDIVKIDTISPVLGKEFIKNALFLALLSTAAVAIVLMAVYRRWKVVLPILFTAFAEVTIVLGIASLIRWNLDLASIAGIIIAIGTGVNDQIIITDEAFHKESTGAVSWRERIKRAFSVVFAAYFTNMVAMVALWFFGAGLLKGFAITTILAVTAGVLITRPAYAAIVNLLAED